jgi:glutamate synthase (NADPH) large chain
MLYDKSQERDNCGFGLIAHIEGEPSHKVVRTAIHALARMQHRGAILADGKTGDGCGLLLQKPDRFFRMVAEERSWRLAKNYAVGMMFLSQNEEEARASRRIVEEELQNETLSVVGWREVPTNPDVLGEIALSSLPRIEQIFVNAPAGWRPRDMERRLFIARRRIEKRVQDDSFYVCSFSNLVTIYKGLCMPADLPRFYLDLADLRLESAICLFHQRFPPTPCRRWPLAQPFRFLAHNGEINTITGNRQLGARPVLINSPDDADGPAKSSAPLVNRNRFRLQRAWTTCWSCWWHRRYGPVPRRAHAGSASLAERRGPWTPICVRSIEFNSMHMEPWDGPAGIVMSDGRYAACNLLDRNGLRPARWVTTTNGFITLASEVGVWNYQPEDVIAKGRVGPGQILAVDTETGQILDTDAIDNRLKSRHPYKQWLRKNALRIQATMEDNDHGSAFYDVDQLKQYMKMYQVTFEERDQVLRPLGEQGYEAVGSMGDDTPMAVLSQRVRTPYDYFRQQFAQVTNPPIDPLREAIVMSLEVCLGAERNIFQESPEHASRVILSSPVISPAKWRSLMTLERPGYRADTLDLTFDPRREPRIWSRPSVRFVADQAERKPCAPVPCPAGADRPCHHRPRQRLPVPALQWPLARCRPAWSKKACAATANIIVETASARDPHHFRRAVRLWRDGGLPVPGVRSAGQIDPIPRQVVGK